MHSPVLNPSEGRASQNSPEHSLSSAQAEATFLTRVAGSRVVAIQHQESKVGGVCICKPLYVVHSLSDRCMQSMEQGIQTFPALWSSPTRGGDIDTTPAAELGYALWVMGKPQGDLSQI